MNRGARINRKKKVARIIREDIGPDNEFTVFDVYSLWSRRWGRLPSIKELSKVLPTNPALDRYKVSAQSLMIYVWDGEKDLDAYVCETPEELERFKALKKSLQSD